MSVVPLAEVRAHLNFSASTVNDTELQRFVDSAEASIGEVVGPLTPTPRVDRVVGQGYRIVLPVTPVVSIQSITPMSGLGWLSIDPLGTVLDIDKAAGVVMGLAVFPAPYYDVAYTAGWAALPENLRTAVKEQTRHLWKSQRGQSLRPGTADPQPAPGMVELFPAIVESLIGASESPGFS